MKIGGINRHKNIYKLVFFKNSSLEYRGVKDIYAEKYSETSISGSFAHISAESHVKINKMDYLIKVLLWAYIL